MLPEEEKVAKASTLRYGLLGLTLVGLGFAIDLGRFSDWLILIGAVMLSVARYMDVLIAAIKKRKKD
jgi:hypothetical protein